MIHLLMVLAVAQKADSNQDLVDLMKRTKVSVELNNAPLQDMVEIVRGTLNRNFIVSPKVWEDHTEENTRVTVTLKDVSVHTLLRVTLRPRNLTVTVNEGILMIVPISAVREKAYVKIYDVRDLVVPIRNFTPPAVKWGIQNTGDGSEGASYSSIFGAIDASDGGEDNGGTSIDTLQQLIETHTGAASWTDNPEVSISFVNGLMVVSQTKKAHQEIDDLLNALRRMR